MRLLHGDHRPVDLVGDADAAGLGEGLGVFIRQERTPDAGCAFTPEGAFAIDAGIHLLQHRIEEHRLEVLRDGLRRSHVRRTELAGCRRRDFECVERAQAGHGEAEVAGHHITSISAWMAPAALMAWRMAIRSRGPMPSAFSPSTSCCNET